MAKTKNPPKRRTTASETFDGVYLLKMVLYLLIGSLWLKIGHQSSLSTVPIPIGLAIGLVFTTHEHFRIDRKIEYAVLVAAMLFGYFAPYGIYVSL